MLSSLGLTSSILPLLKQSVLTCYQGYCILFSSNKYKKQNKPKQLLKIYKIS